MPRYEFGCMWVQGSSGPVAMRSPSVYVNNWAVIFHILEKMNKMIIILLVLPVI